MPNGFERWDSSMERSIRRVGGPRPDLSAFLEGERRTLVGLEVTKLRPFPYAHL